MDKEALFKKLLDEEDVDVPGRGTVRIRALSRAEALRFSDKAMARDDLERKMLALAMVDPVLTEGEVRLWQEASPAGELQAVTNRVTELSGMQVRGGQEDREDAPDKAAYKSVRG